MNSTKPRGTARVADRRRGDDTRASGSASGLETRDPTTRQRLNAPGVMRILPLLLLLILPILAQAQYEYTVANGSVTITKYTGPGGDVVIPGTIEGLQVARIARRAFYGCTGVISVVIPIGVTTIESETFSACSSLSRVTVPDGVASIGSYTFHNCTSLTGVIIPNSVTSIASGAFSGCAALTSVNIPNSVTGLGDGVFAGCASLTQVAIPNTVSRIGHSAFFGCASLTSVSLHDDITSIGLFAFSGCSGLTSVTLGRGVSSIPSEAFAGCLSLRALYFRGDAPVIAEDAFAGVDNVTVYYVPGTSGWEETIAVRPTMQWSGLFGVHEIKVYSGLTLIGEIGKVYSIEYVTDLSDPAESDWRCLEYLQLPASPYLWADKAAPATGKRFYRTVAMEAPPNMVFIPPGTFRMGSPEDEVDRYDWEGPQTDVIISRGFWMGKYEVTQGEYEAVMGNNPSHFNGVRQAWDPELETYIDVDYGTDPNRPVEFNSEFTQWFAANSYCEALTARERAVNRIPAGTAYRLPTYGEWEYACRAGTSTRFSYGDDPDYTKLTDYAWYADNSDGQTHPVGQKLPNRWGLYDMHGNVWEWCLARSYTPPGGIVLEPPEGAAPSVGWVGFMRGGGLSGEHFGGYAQARYCRTACRTFRSTGTFPGLAGFRVVLAPVQP
jgi:formylglycine-generating enzyme required for sulfatase activity